MIRRRNFCHRKSMPENLQPVQGFCNVSDREIYVFGREISEPEGSEFEARNSEHEPGFQGVWDEKLLSQKSMPGKLATCPRFLHRFRQRDLCLRQNLPTEYADRICWPLIVDTMAHEYVIPYSLVRPCIKRHGGFEMSRPSSKLRSLWDNEWMGGF